MDSTLALQNALKKCTDDYEIAVKALETLRVDFDEIMRLHGVAGYSIPHSTPVTLNVATPSVTTPSVTTPSVTTPSVAPLNVTTTELQPKFAIPESPEKAEFKKIQKTIVGLLGLDLDQAFEIKSKILTFRSSVDKLSLPDKQKIELVTKVVFETKKIIADDIRLVIIRGIPGSGKTTTSKLLKICLDILQNRAVDYFEADIYMGNTFDAKRLNACHTSCKNDTEKHLEGGGIAIVSNTNRNIVEILPYWQIAQAVVPNFTKTQVLILEPFTSWKRDANICRQKCSKKTIPANIFTSYLNDVTGISVSDIQDVFINVSINVSIKN